MTDDEYGDLMFEKIVEALDFDKLLDLLRQEYDRGYDEGYKQGQLDLLAAVRERVTGTEKPKQITYEKPIAKSNEEVKAEEPQVPAEPEPDPPKSAFEPGTVITDDNGYKGRIDEEGVIRSESTPEPEKLTSAAPEAQETASKPEPNVGGRPPKEPRPINIPTNYHMALAALRELGPSSAPQIREFIRRRWWPNVPKEWTSVLWGFAEDGRFGRDGINFTIVVPKPKPPSPPKDPQTIINREVARRQVVTPGAKLGPPAKQDGVLFQYKDRSLTLHSREAAIMVQLRSAMNQGHLDAKFLANLIGIKGEAESTMRDMVSILNPKIESLKLRVDWYRGFGFIMKEVGA